MEALDVIFTDPDELEVARVLADCVPSDIGGYPFKPATLSGIVTKAYDTVRRLGAASPIKSDVMHDLENFCRQHRILERLKENGYAESGGVLGGSPGEPLYTRPNSKIG